MGGGNSCYNVRRDPKIELVWGCVGGLKRRLQNEYLFANEKVGIFENDCIVVAPIILSCEVCKYANCIGLDHKIVSILAVK